MGFRWTRGGHVLCLGSDFWFRVWDLGFRPLLCSLTSSKGPDVWALSLYRVYKDSLLRAHTGSLRRLRVYRVFGGF